MTSIKVRNTQTKRIVKLTDEMIAGMKYASHGDILLIRGQIWAVKYKVFVKDEVIVWIERIM